MTKPKPHELAAVRKLGRLGALETDRLRHMLQTLGFSLPRLTEVTNVSASHWNQVFFEDHSITADDFARLCDLVEIKPGAIQGSVNFNETKLGTTKAKGFKAQPKALPWQGPPALCIKADTSERGIKTAGKAFKELYLAPGVEAELPTESRFQRKQLDQIANANLPVSLQALRDLIAAVETVAPGHKRLEVAKKVLDGFPPGIKTYYDIKNENETAGATGKGKDDGMPDGNKMTTSEIVWRPSLEKAEYADIGDVRYSLKKGEQMQQVARHIRAAIKRDGTTPKPVLETIGKGHRYLKSVEDGNNTFSAEELVAMANLLCKDGETVAIFFIGAGLQEFIEEVDRSKKGADADEVSPTEKELAERQEYFRARVIDPKNLAEGVDAAEVMAVMGKALAGEDVDWVSQWLTFTTKGRKMQSAVTQAMGETKGCGSTVLGLYRELLNAGLDAIEASQAQHGSGNS